MPRICTYLLAAVGVAGVSFAATAHHSFARFDQNTTKVWSGTIKEWHWTNPHVFVMIQSNKGTLVLEGSSPNNLVRAGLRKQMLKIGDKITVNYNPDRTDPLQGSLRQITMINNVEKNIKTL